MNQQQKTKARKLAKRGTPAEEIARELGVSLDAVREAIATTPTKKAKPATPTDDDDTIDPTKRAIAVRELTNGMTVAVAAAESGLDVADVQRIKEALARAGDRAAAEHAAAEQDGIRTFTGPGGSGFATVKRRDRGIW